MWHPAVRKGAKPIYEQLIEGLERDVTSGVLATGAQLPPQRDLAYRLKIGVGTVTKVYAEARRRGLLTATVGRGSFIAGPSDSATQSDGNRTIDFSRNITPRHAAAARLGDALSSLRRRSDPLHPVSCSAHLQGFLSSRRAFRLRPSSRAPARPVKDSGFFPSVEVGSGKSILRRSGPCEKVTELL